MIKNTLVINSIKVIGTTFCLWTALSFPNFTAVAAQSIAKNLDLRPTSPLVEVTSVTTRPNQTLTAQDQASGSNVDVEITRRIRKAINSKNLSLSAKNIKIITVNGEITLRGPVRSLDEENKVLSIAKSYVKNSHKINNQMEVK